MSALGRGWAAAALVAACAAVLAVGASAAIGKKQIRVTFVGDSVAASIHYVPSARDRLARGLRLRLDLAVCRRLVSASCSYQGTTPSTALQAVQSLGRSLGDVLVVDVGYNEGAGGYREGMRRIIRAALAQGAKGVVWVTLREYRDIYRSTNVSIRSEAKRWRQVRVADWNAFSSGKPWFRGDGLHLTSAGAHGLADLVRPYVLEAASSQDDAAGTG
jgi:hypothetical protein